MSQSTLQEGNSGGSPLKTRLVSWSAAALRAPQGWLRALDQILRGETTRPSALREQSLRDPDRRPVAVDPGIGVVLRLLHGHVSGLPRSTTLPWLRWLACTLKIPALFLLTLCVTFPSLYVVNALVGSRLQLLAVLQLLVAALGVNLAVLASAGPIVAFFSFSTTNCPFMVLLNVLVFAVSGLLGMAFLLQTLHRLSTIPKAARRRLAAGPLPGRERERRKRRSPSGPGETGEAGRRRPCSQSWEHDRWLSDPKGPPPAASPAEAVRSRARKIQWLDRLEGRVLGRHVKTVFCCWTVIFSVVGGQMAWVLRPYFGNANPNEPFVWFGPRTSNFFEGVWQALHQPIVPSVEAFRCSQTFSLVDDVLRRRPWTTRTAVRGRTRALGACVFAFGFLYGTAMGSYGGVGGDRVWQLLYSGLKVPVSCWRRFSSACRTFSFSTRSSGCVATFARRFAHWSRRRPGWPSCWHPARR